MKPENIQDPSFGAEQLPMPPSIGSERVPTLPPLAGTFEQGQQRVEQAAEAGAMASDAATLAGPMAVPVMPVVPAPPVNDNPVSAPVGSPMVAADEDLIEKEWVDKAKEIIEQTKDDPHARTQKVNELQRDYLQKRYGKVVGASE